MLGLATNPIPIKAAMKLLGRDPGSEIREDLRQFKQIVEGGEVPTTHGQPRG